MTGSVSRRTVLTTGLAVAAGSALPVQPSSAATSARRAKPLVDDHTWLSRADWAHGHGAGTRPAPGHRAGVTIGRPLGTFDYTDPHTGKTATWEYATWTSPTHRLRVPSTEAIASWNAHVPAGTWIAIELRGAYSDGTATPWYVMGRWAAGDGDIRRTSVDDQTDGKSTIYTDTFSIDSPSSGLRLVSYQLRLTLYRKPGSRVSPTVWRLGAMGSDIPDRFEVPASKPGVATGHELRVPRYSQSIHHGQYPEYDNGGEAWCSPTSSQMIIEYWGRKPTPQDLAWVNPAYADPQVCHAARFTYDYQYEGCGNWPFNVAYAATYRDMQGVVTRLSSLSDAEILIRAGIPLITSQSFLESELDGAGYGTSGHLMTVIGFTKDGDIVANDPASPSDEAVRHVYKRRQWENIWLRTKRKRADGTIGSGTGGVCYIYFPTRLTHAQRHALTAVGIRP
jgi:hypothetical protein